MRSILPCSRSGFPDRGTRGAEPVRASGRRAPRSMILAGSVLILGLALVPGSAGGLSADPGEAVAAAPGLSRSEAEQIIYRYLAQDVPRLVGLRHRAEYLAELEADPPRFDEHDRYHFNSPGGLLEFAYDGERGALIVRAAIHRYKGRQQGHGLSFDQIAEAVERYAATGAPLGGGRLDTAPELDGVFLRRDFVEPPRSTRAFARRVDDLIKAANRWFRKDYIKALEAYARTLAPPASATAAAGGFSATIALTEHPDLYAKVWSRPPGALQPWHVSVHTVRPGTELVLAIHLVDPAAGADGNARVEATTRLVGPDGAERGTPTELELWQGPPPPAGHFQLADPPVTVGFAATEPAGTYKVLADVCDRVAGRCVHLVHPVELLARQR